MGVSLQYMQSFPVSWSVSSLAACDCLTPTTASAVHAVMLVRLIRINTQFV